MEERGAEQDKQVCTQVISHLCTSVGPSSYTSRDHVAGQKPASPAPASKAISPSFWCQRPAPVPRFKTSGRELLQKEKATANDF